MKTYEVRILGQRYKIRSDEGEEYIQHLADFVNEQVTEIQKKSKTVAAQTATILAALHIADQYLKLRDQNTRFRQQLGERVRRALKMIRSGERQEETRT